MSAIMSDSIGKALADAGGAELADLLPGLPAAAPPQVVES
jgi:hypothetical protein